MALVPGQQDGFDAREILVERGTANTGLFGNLRHGDRTQPMSGNECRGSLEDRVMHPAAMRLNGLVPELRDHARVRDGQSIDTLYYT